MGSNLSTIGPAEIAHGPLFIGLFLNVVLYGIMIIQTYMYFLTYPRDKAWTKAFVAVILLLDTLNTIFDFAYLYKCLIKNFGNVEVLARADWLFATDPATTAIIAVAVQLFYAWRVKVLTGNLWLVAAVVGSAFVAFSGGIGTSVEVHLHPYFINFISFKSVVITWLVGSAVADVIITSILVVHLKSHKTGLAGSDLLVDRIIRMTVQTGLATSLCATIDLILYLTDPVALHLIFNIPLCKLYTNSLLSSLNSRSTPEGSSADTGLTSKRASLVPPSRNRASLFIEYDEAPAPMPMRDRLQAR
ncbi:hypothetical protein HMN09_00225700 [Mycena chlorophos]|uniref:DUF6534 domain-containing protein n=1 Tax=Mycena chlorophos TaxID=658473 RepID=A0A8H6WHK2_MYCCL|nr:hypothetical protein HMN09_00225700 [Mycena chlorophos]